MAGVTCEWVHEGTIALRWRTADSTWWDSYKANSTYVWTAWDGTKHVYSGSYAWTMASAEGSALGFPLVIVEDMDGGFATLINSRRIEISIEK